MTSKVVAPPAPQDPKLPPLSPKDGVKAQGTSGNDEPTNSSSAENPRPQQSSTKASKAPEAFTGHERATDKPIGAQLNGSKSVPETAPTPPKPISKAVSIAELRRLARKPGLKLEPRAKEELSRLIESHKNEGSKSQNSAQILGKRLRKNGDGQESYRELLCTTESLEEYGHRVQAPQIFEKTLQLPPRLPGLAPLSNPSQSGAVSKPSDTFQALQGAQANGFNSMRSSERALNGTKRMMLPVLTREEAGLVNYDFGLCSNQIELQKSQTKCFENMLDLISLTYFGTQTSLQTSTAAATSTTAKPTDALAAAPLRRETQFTTGVAHQQANGTSGGARGGQTDSRDDTKSGGAQQASLAAQGGSTGLSRQIGTVLGGTMSESQKRMKLSQLDYLANPLRSDHPFETWSMKEMALFSACICQFGKRFDLFVPLIKSKTEQEIYEFYRCWKYTKYYKTWKVKAKDRPKLTASLSDVIYHDRQI